MYFRAITAASDECHPGYIALLESALARGVAVANLCRGTKYTGLTSKLKMSYQFAKGAHTALGRTIIMFVDGYDVLITSSLPEIQTAFVELDCGIVFSAEKICYPFAGKAYSYPKHPSGYSFLNSGCWIAYSDSVIEAFEAMNVMGAGDDVCDQGMMTTYYLSNMDKIKLDNECKIFQSLYFARRDLEFVDGRVRNKITDTYPMIFHGNGNADMSAIHRWTTPQ